MRHSRSFASAFLRTAAKGGLRLSPQAGRGDLSSLIYFFKQPTVIARSEATKQSILSLRGDMDCFASLAMTWKHKGSFSRRKFA
jgi:hypothetical protein